MRVVDDVADFVIVGTGAGGATAANPPAAPRYPVITEDLSPIDLLVKYTPDPHLALEEDPAPEAAGVEGARHYRRRRAGPG